MRLPCIRASRTVLAVALVCRPSAAEQAIGVSDARTALPGVVRVPMLDFGAPRMSAALDTGYAVTESQHGEGAHHRASGTFGFGLAPMRMLELGLLASIRHDRHPADAIGPDQGTTGQFSAAGRTGTRVGPALQLGAEAAVMFPGSEKLGDSVSHPAFDLRALLGSVPQHGVRSAAFLGFRFDRTAGVGANAPRYREGDRLALGLSQFNSVLVGTGIIVPLGSRELLAEVSADLLVGTSAPRVTQSPLRADVGMRQPVSEHLWFELLSELSLSSRPVVAVGSPLVPVEPRLTITVGLRYRSGPRAPDRVRPTSIAQAPAGPIKSAEPQPIAPEPVMPATGQAQVTVCDTAGQPLSDAVVTLVTEQGELPLQFRSGSTFALDSVPVGHAKLVVRADLMRDWVGEVDIVSGKPLEQRVEMLPAENSGQIRGLVRGFDGRALAAHVQIEPGARNEHAGADGVFSVDVPPGRYRVKVYLDGYQSQERVVDVGKNGVMVLNVDLQRGR